MLMTNFLRGRKSEREFKAKTVDSAVLENISQYLRDLEKEEEGGNFRFKLFENGEKVYSKLKGVGGYSGVMIESPHYIGLELINNQEASLLYGAYYMEKLITKLNAIGLGTCWVSVGGVDSGVKRDIFGEMVGEINYLLAFGHGKAKNPFISEPFSHRIGVDEMVFVDKLGSNVDPELLETRGLDDLFYYVRFSPSTLNKQPWRFLLENDKVTLLLEYEENQEPNLIDAGVIMYYFEELGRAVGISEGWTLLDKVEKFGDKNYKYVGEIKL